MDSIIALLMPDITVFDELAMFTVICRIIVMLCAFELVGTLVSYLGKVGR